MTATNTRLWLKRYGKGAPPTTRLFCFHHAGGSAALYRDWHRLLPPSVEPVAVQLPGRADRLGEQPFTELEPLVEALAEAIEPLLDLPYVCYGLSMGAKLCWVLTHRLREQGMPLPLGLYLSGAAAPDLREGRTDWNVPDEQLTCYLREMGGTPPELFDHPALLASLLPALRADLTLIDGSRFEPTAQLDLPIRAFAGIEDIEGGPERMHGWARQTSGRFTLEELPGGHFPDAAGKRRVTQVIADDLRWKFSGVGRPIENGQTWT
jgi:medium-chain acyl-[acyl-carrier-protein] hydrolase